MADTPPSNPPPHWARLHIWQIQPIRDILLIFAIFWIVWLGNRISIVTVPLLLALLLAYLVEPLINWLVRRKVATRRGAAITIVLLGVAALIGPVGIGGGFAAWQGVRLAGRTVHHIDELLQSVADPENDELRDRLHPVWKNARDRIVADESLRREIAPLAKRKPDDTKPSTPETVGPSSTPDVAAVTPTEEESDSGRLIKWAVGGLRDNAVAVSHKLFAAGEGILGGALDVLTSIGRFVFGAFLTAFFFFFMCTGWGRVKAFWESLIPERRRGRVVELVQRMDRVIAGFIRGRLTVAAVQIITYTVGYVAIGVPAPLVVGPIMGILTIIPYASGVAAPIAMGLMWLDPASGFRGEWWWIVGGPLIMLAIAQGLDDYVLTPAIQGKATNMDTPTILFASIAGGALAGFYGVLVAIPVAACLKILLKEVFFPRFKAWTEGRVPDVLPMRNA